GYEPKATMAPKSAVKPPELDISRRAANMLENVKKALWLSTYKRDYTGIGSMNPLLLDDYNAKVIGRATGELGHDVELRELFPSETSQVRPLEGRIARYLQGREYHFADPQQKHYAEMQRLALQCTDKPVAHAYSEGAPNAREVSLSTFPQCPIIESGVKKKTEHLPQNQNCPQAFYQEESDQCKVLPFRKITDTWKIEKLYQRQLAVPPEPEVILKPVDSIYYEDLKPSRFNNYIVWHHPVSLSKPASLDLTSKKHSDVPAVQFASNTKDVVTSSGFPEWIPNCGVPRPQTKLLDIQDSFRKCEAIKRLNDLTRGGIRDLRDHDREGRRHKFHGMHAFLFS
uniref:Uncharacterized protein n=1 Tax=Salvator merianae TaxID=96440 RepID=A0A8D0BE42_SALMN